MNLIHAGNGIVFNGLKQILLIDSGWFPNDKAIITACLNSWLNIDLKLDSGFSRKMMKQTMTVNDWNSFLRKNMPYEEYAKFMVLHGPMESSELVEIVLPDNCMMLEILATCLIRRDSSLEAIAYWSYIQDLCHKERQVATQLLEYKEDKQQFVSLFESHVSSMMSMPSFRVLNEKSRQMFLVTRVLYWAALAELYLRIFSEFYRKDLGELSAGMSLFLPSVGKKGALVRSKRKFLDNQKAIWTGIPPIK